MEYVGRRVKKKFRGNGTHFGLVQAYEAATGLFKIVYDDGDSEELELKEVVSSLLMSGEPPPPQPLGSSAGRVGRKPKKRCRIGVPGKGSINSANGSGASDGLVDRDGELDLNLAERLDLNDGAVNSLRRGGSDVNVSEDKLHGLDLNERLNLESDEGLRLSKEVIEEDSLAKKEMIDLNLDVNEDFEKLSDEREDRCFDLNLQLIEDEVKISECCDARLGADGKVCGGVNMEMKERMVESDALGVLENVDGGKGDPTIDTDTKEDMRLKNTVAVPENGNVAPCTVQVKRRGRKKKKASINSIGLATSEAPKLDAVIENMNLEMERRDETPLKNVGLLVDHGNGNPETVLRGRGRKRKELSNNDASVATPETGLRRSIRRAKMAALSDQDQVFNEAELVGINLELSSPAISNVSQEKVTVMAREIFSNHVALPPKVNLPPSSCYMDLIGVSLFDLVSVYTFLRSFSALLFLSPFKLDDFVASVKCTNSSLLFDSVHFSLLKTLRKHLESLAAEGSVSASDCLR